MRTADKLRALAESIDFEDTASMYVTMNAYRSAQKEHFKLKAALLAAADVIEASRKVLDNAVYLKILAGTLYELEEVLK